ncbi:beta-ketoacyl synthase N-terminal-like domain-containing protein [Streptomyces sp. NPDC002523]
MTDGVAVTAMAVLTGVVEDLAAYTAVLRAGEPRSVGRLSGFSVREWAARHLPDDQEAATRLLRAAGGGTLPARSAACVAVAALRAAGTDESDLADAALLVAGNNLALAYQAEAQARFENGKGRVRAGHILDHLDTDVVGTVSQATGIQGEGWTVGAASASGTVAIIQAARLLKAGLADRCLVVGPVCELSPLEIAAFSLSGAMAVPAEGEPVSGLCRPFDKTRRGFVYGQGAAAVLLETSRTAGGRALAEVIGYGSRLDGRRGAEPDAHGQMHAMRKALAMGGVQPGEVDLVNAHATGSVLGDQVEAEALVAVFGERGPVVNSTKALIGHGLTCAGLLEFVGVVLQMRHGFVHGNPLLQNPLEVPLAFAGRAGEPVRAHLALSNSFAFGGISASVLLKS